MTWYFNIRFHSYQTWVYKLEHNLIFLPFRHRETTRLPVWTWQNVNAPVWYFRFLLWFLELLTDLSSCWFLVLGLVPGSFVVQLPMSIEWFSRVVFLCSSGEEYEPSFYKLDDGNSSVCLATGFSRFGQLGNNSWFNHTEAVRISQDSLFNQLAFVNDSASPKNCPEGASLPSPPSLSAEMVPRLVPSDLLPVFQTTLATAATTLCSPVGISSAAECEAADLPDSKSLQCCCPQTPRWTWCLSWSRDCASSSWRRWCLMFWWLFVCGSVSVSSASVDSQTCRQSSPCLVNWKCSLSSCRTSAELHAGPHARCSRIISSLSVPLM